MGGWREKGEEGWMEWGGSATIKKYTHTHTHADALKKTFINQPHLNVNKWQMARLNRLSGPSELVCLM